ncbi:hypothetical protein HUT05_25010 [Streptomyces chartreusis]|uniref:Uncharacterized protein n=2 Tax=Streptomyces chartreusis TaxID=1969 RepID=A0A7H8TN77_STRCX|nr:hypothetical protein HUT05_25010 [Streptomyces chartreusis]
MDAASHTKPAPWYSVAPAFAPPPDSCRICGAIPAAFVELRAHQGLLFFMRWTSVDGWFCGACGIAQIRELTTRTLWQGWWGPLSMFATMHALLRNWRAYRQLRRLDPPSPVPGRPQTPQGHPVWQRPQAYLALIPVIWAASLIASNLKR